jgi:hypothetical protein
VWESPLINRVFGVWNSQDGVGGGEGGSAGVFLVLFLVFVYYWNVFSFDQVYV